jgi:hypothetical protein
MVPQPWAGGGTKLKNKIVQNIPSQTEEKNKNPIFSFLSRRKHPIPISRKNTPSQERK